MKENNTYRYFSQNGEDCLLWSLFDYKENGWYVDVGAFDGIHFSNSFSFEQQGWLGICIEPQPFYFKLCQQNRPAAICLNVACVADAQIRTTEFYTEELGLLSGVLGNREREDDVRLRYTGRGLEFKGFEKIIVPALTLNTILEQYLPAGAEIDFLSIDVEGTELDVLKGLDLSRYRPRVMVIEANSKEDRAILNAFMIKLNGYHEGPQLDPNIFYIRDATDVKRLRAISLDCYIERNLHPLGEKYTPPVYLHRARFRRQPKKTLKVAVTRVLKRWQNTLSVLFRKTIKFLMFNSIY